MRGLNLSGFTIPSPVQRAAIPLGRLGADLVVQAKSGTGKTVTFGAILCERVDRSSAYPQALVLAPTREVALQSRDALAKLARAPDPPLADRRRALVPGRAAPDVRPLAGGRAGARGPLHLRSADRDLPDGGLGSRGRAALADGARHGYGIIKEVEDRFGAGAAPSTGALYLALQRMEGEGLIEETTERPSEPSHERTRSSIRPSRRSDTTSRSAKISTSSSSTSSLCGRTSSQLAFAVASTGVLISRKFRASRFVRM